MRIYLADLGHNLLTRSSDVYPLGVANLAAYATAHVTSREPLEIALFREPEDLKTALDAAAPDILGLSNYAWNQALSTHFAAYAKRLHPRTLTAMGGPNYPLVDSVRREFLGELPGVDVYVNGPTYEGERAFRNLVQRFVDTGGREGVFEAPIDGVVWLNRATSELVAGAAVPRITDLDEIPSPYLGGWMNPFLATGYFPMMQVARGCPFSCTFCNSGVHENDRVHAHSVANVKADLLFLAERVRPELPLCLADDNFGMFARDEEIAEFVGWLQDNFRWPRYIRTTTGKNNSERIVRVMRKARGALPMTAAVQSMNPQVLVNIKRDNVKLETYRAIQAELDRQGMQSYGELILCLPGETKATFMKGVEDLLDAGSNRISAHQLMLLHGAELANPAERARFEFDSRFRVVARNIGNYTGEPVVEIEEMVVGTPDFSLDDYFETRLFHLLLTIYCYEGNFDEALAFARQYGVKPFDLVVRMRGMIDDAPAEFRRVLDDFLVESRDELFDTREACDAWARAHYDELVDGSRGGNLLSKFSMIGRFYATIAAIAFLERGIATILRERGVDFDAEELDAVMSYLRAVVLHVPFAETLAARRQWTSRFDVDRWFSDRPRRPLSAYAFPEARTMELAVDPATRAVIERHIATFGEHPSGLGKFTRSVFARDVRRRLTAEVVR